MAQSPDARPIGDREVVGLIQPSFVEIDHEICFTVILFLPLIVDNNWLVNRSDGKKCGLGMTLIVLTGPTE